MKRSSFRCMQCDKMTSGYSIRWRWLSFSGYRFVHSAVCVACAKIEDWRMKYL